MDRYNTYAARAHIRSIQSRKPPTPIPSLKRLKREEPYEPTNPPLWSLSTHTYDPPLMYFGAGIKFKDIGLYVDKYQFGENERVGNDLALAAEFTLGVLHDILLRMEVPARAILPIGPLSRKVDVVFAFISNKGRVLSESQMDKLLNIMREEFPNALWGWYMDEEDLDLLVNVYKVMKV